jgi:single-strand DNA-binding protein
MAKSLNKVMLIGNLGKDPELRYTTSGVAVATFSLATNEQWKDQDGNAQERTEWHNIVAWKKLAEICGEWLKKGKKIYVEGRIQTRSYDDKNTGAKKYITEIVAENIIMLDGKGSSEGSAASTGASEAAAAPAAAGRVNEDLPF